MHAPLRVDRLRRLTLDAQDHPRGQPHFSAASGLVCGFDRVYVIGDDEQHVAIYRDRASAGRLHPLLDGDLPLDARDRKRHKADLESLLWLPQAASLVALGSGSTPRRERGVRLVLSRQGEPQGAGQPFDLAPLYQPLRARHGAINIEGAFAADDAVMLLNRGHPNGAGNLLLRYRLQDFVSLMAGERRSAVEPQSVQAFDLGQLDGVALGFTDAAALPDGGWIFSAAAEDSADSVADGTCCGSVLGRVAADGRLLALHPLGIRDKVEGVDVLQQPGGLAVFMVTDADDPTQAAWLLSARL